MQTRGTAPPSPGTFQEHTCTHASLSARQPGPQVRKPLRAGTPPTWPGQQDGQRKALGSLQGLAGPGGLGELGAPVPPGWPASGPQPSQLHPRRSCCPASRPAQLGLGQPARLQMPLGSQEHTRHTYPPGHEGSCQENLISCLQAQTHSGRWPWVSAGVLSTATRSSVSEGLLRFVASSQPPSGRSPYSPAPPASGFAITQRSLTPAPGPF